VTTPCFADAIASTAVADARDAAGVATIRPFEPGDALPLQDILAGRPVAELFFGAVRHAADLQDHMRHAWGREAPGALRLVACRPTDGAVVGAARVDGAELSYLVSPDHWRLGIGTLLAKAACARAPQRPLVARVFRENIASRSLLERLGFSFAGLSPAEGGSYRERSRLLYRLHA
jgi:RimJ/RimL family protein N-acetyltransferase